MANRKPVILGIIPARGGSKAIPKKNIAMVAGEPLITYTIHAALSASCIDRLIISTDSQEIADLAADYGADVPFLRPFDLAQDDTPGIEPINHAVLWLEENEGYRPDYVMVLQPTSPLRTAQDIDAAVKIAVDLAADGVVSVCPVHQHPYWMKKVAEDGQLIDFLTLDRIYARRQDLPHAYSLNGAIYLIQRDVLLEQHTFFTPRTYGYIMPQERSLDIDTSWDLYIVDLILKDRLTHESN